MTAARSCPMLPRGRVPGSLGVREPSSPSPTGSPHEAPGQRPPSDAPVRDLVPKVWRPPTQCPPTLRGTALRSTASQQVTSARAAARPLLTIPASIVGYRRDQRMCLSSRPSPMTSGTLRAEAPALRWPLASYLGTAHPLRLGLVGILIDQSLLLALVMPSQGILLVSAGNGPRGMPNAWVSSGES